MVLSICTQEGERGHVNIKALLGNPKSHEEPRGVVQMGREMP